MAAVASKLPDETTEEEQRRTRAFTFMGRAWLGLGLCQLAAGQALSAEKSISTASRSMFGISDTEYAEKMFAFAIIFFETGDLAKAKEYILIAGRRGPSIIPTIEAYRKAVGLTL
jgi:Tfp pilus assembly protein PilF